MTPRGIWPVLCATTAFATAACSVFPRGSTPPPLTTYERVLPLAFAGHPEYQNLVGFMHYHGEGVDQDREAALRWFRLAAANGHALGRLNETLMREQAAGIEPATPATEVQPIPRGEWNYTRFCAGCHGLNGIAAFTRSPSFALGERMERTDAELFRSVSDGIGEMPGWGGKLPDHILVEVIAFVRTLQDSYRRGVRQPLRDGPEVYYLFGPMSRDHRAFARDGR